MFEGPLKGVPPVEAPLDPRGWMDMGEVIMEVKSIEVGVAPPAELPWFGGPLCSIMWDAGREQLRRYE